MNDTNNIDQKDELLETIESEEIDSEMDTAEFKINTYGADFTLELLSKKIDDKEIIVPPFQRRYVWPIKKASKLIESFLLGLPVPQVFLYRNNETQDLLVVDGQQRLKTVNFFFKGKFDNKVIFKLRGVHEKWNGKTFDDLDISEKRKINNYILRANIFEQTDPQDNSSIFEIFERLNTGGMALNQQEIRNCIIRGDVGLFLDELNIYPVWREKILRKKYPDERMRDTEMILRFWALFEERGIYKKPMKDFITNFMKKKRKLDDSEKSSFRELFFKCINLVSNEIPEKPFRLTAGINIAIFDSVMVAIATIGADRIANFKQKYEKLLLNESYLTNVSEHTTDSDQINARIEAAISHFCE